VPKPSEFWDEIMAFGTPRAALTAVIIVCGAMAVVPFVSAQTPDRELRRDAFRAFAAGSEIGVSVRELSDDEASKAGFERTGGVYVRSVRQAARSASAPYIDDGCGRRELRYQNCC
jgi:hypothetical protein